jgi:uncharacterized damage-inducible protein DinB
MDIDGISLLYKYSDWADQRILETAKEISPARFLEPVPGLSHGSLRGILVHALSARWIWRSRCQGISPQSVLNESDFANHASVRAGWEKEAQAMRLYLDSLGHADLTQTIRYTTTGGKPYQNTLWHLLLQVLNHNTQHRSEAAMLLTEWGHSPGDLDLILFLREKS